MKSFDASFLRQAGFSGFIDAVPLANSSLEHVPNEPGVYVVLRTSNNAPEFLQRSSAGRFKGRDPSVSKDRLMAEWVRDTSILYIGKADQQTLRQRIHQYLQFGFGKPVGHWGGRFIWQLADARELIFCWKITGSQPAREVERQMLADFRKCYGKLPFANLKA